MLLLFIQTVDFREFIDAKNLAYAVSLYVFSRKMIAHENPL
jgi:hypothetical protein